MLTMIELECALMELNWLGLKELGWFSRHKSYKNVALCLEGSTMTEDGNKKLGYQPNPMPSWDKLVGTDRN